MTTSLWYQSHTNLVELAYWLDENGFFSRPAIVIGFFEKPWQYEDQWLEFQAEIDQALGVG